MTSSMTQPARRSAPALEVLAGSTAQGEPTLACKNLTFSYQNGYVATRDLSLTVQPGEILCLLGPNGAGKTTLVRLLSGGLRPSHGSISLAGRALQRGSTKPCDMGVIPQSAGLFAGLTVDQHLKVFGPLKDVRGMKLSSEIERVIMELGLQSLRKKRVGALSGGQQRMLLVALAMLGAPKLLILDEPSVGLDPVARRALWQAIVREKKRGTAILLTTHYLDEAEQLADRVGFLKAGSLVSCGTLPELHTAFGKTVRVVEYDPTTGAVLAQHYFDELPEARAMIQEKRLETYSLARVPLEDVYVRFYGELQGSSLEGGAACKAFDGRSP